MEQPCAQTIKKHLGFKNEPDWSMETGAARRCQGKSTKSFIGGCCLQLDKSSGQNGLKDEIQQRLQIVIQNNPKFANILLTDTKGQNLISGKIGAPDFSTASTGKLVREVIKTNKEIFGDWYKSSPEEAVYADIAYPIHGDGQEIVAIILFRIDPSIEMYPILETESDNSTEETFLFEKAGDSVLYLTNLKSLPNAHFRSNFP